MIAQAVVVILVIVMGMYIFGVGTDFLDDLVSSADELLAKQNEVPSVPLSRSGNFAKDTGTRVCDLQVTFYGTMTDYNPFSLDPVEILNLKEQRWIWHGGIREEQRIFFVETGIEGRPIATDERTFTYQWYCTGPSITPAQEASAGRYGCITGVSPERIEICDLTLLDLLSWNLNKNTKAGLEQLSLLFLGGETTDKETVRVNYVGKSLTNSDKKLFTPANAKGTEENPFTSSIRLPAGADFPYGYRIETTLSDVTEDNYLLEFWDEDYVQNNKAVGHIFDGKICKPGLNSC